MKHSLSLLACLLLSGCATLNEKECRNGDWYHIGLSDGQSGQTLPRMQKHREACQKYGITPNEVQYQAGREEGLKSYCTLSNAFRIGWGGGSYYGVCPANIDLQFTRCHAAALEVYRVKTQIAEVEKGIRKEEQELTHSKDPRKELLELRTLQNRLLQLRADLQLREQEVNRLMSEAQATQKY